VADRITTQTVHWLQPYLKPLKFDLSKTFQFLKLIRSLSVFKTYQKLFSSLNLSKTFQFLKFIKNILVFETYQKLFSFWNLSKTFQFLKNVRLLSDSLVHHTSQGSIQSLGAMFGALFCVQIYLFKQSSFQFLKKNPLISKATHPIIININPKTNFNFSFAYPCLTRNV